MGFYFWNVQLVLTDGILIYMYNFFKVRRPKAFCWIITVNC